MNIRIVDSGVANLASIRSAFHALDLQVELARFSADLADATHIVLPGVGSFESGMERLRETGMADAIRAASEDGTAILAICLGMQLLTDGSEEALGVAGLGLVPGVCVRLPDSVRVPQLGWNRVLPDRPAGLVREGDYAFANSFVLASSPQGWNTSWSTYGVRFVSAIERGRMLACQFHPELSGKAGMDLITRWVRGGERERSRAVGIGQEFHTVSRETGSPERNTLDGGSRSGDTALVRIIPCLDVRDGRVVKGVRFQNIRDAGDPAELAANYEAQGADEIVILDIAAAPRKQDTQLETIRRVRERIHIPLTVGGGVRSVSDAGRLLNAGADKVSVNTAALRDPALLTRLAAAFGTQCIVVAVDARARNSGWEALVTGGRDETGTDVVAWSREAEMRGAGEILLTSWDRDGTRSGADTALLEAVSGSIRIPVIASGGIGTPGDAVDAVTAGASAVLAASIFHDGDRTVDAVKQKLAEAGVAVRT